MSLTYITMCNAYSYFFFFNDTATTEIYTLSLHDALPISLYDPFREQPGRTHQDRRLHPGKRRRRRERVRHHADHADRHGRHETGHGFSLPDLYDTDGSSEGVGEYSLMGSGNYTSSFSPSRMDVWSLNE